MGTQPRSVPPGTLAHWQPPAGASRSKLLAPPHTETLSRLGDAATAEATPGAGESGENRPHTGPIEVLPVGSLLAERYVIEEHISDGGFGAVYRASDREISNHRLAIKLLHRPAETEEAQANALRELVLIASVSHPSVVQFKDYGWHEGRLWFAMPFFDGETLDARVEMGGQGALGTRQARPIFELLARGLAAMHEVGVNHHDIKPENIFLAEMAGFDEGLPVLLDLGIAAKGDEAPRGFSPAWVAPETARTALGDRKTVVGPSADVYSLALVLRVLLEPETAPNTDLPTPGILTTRAKFPVQPPKARALRHLRRPFERWLNLDPAQRPTAAEFAEELRVLTQPQDRRAARFRMARRVAPAVAAALLGLAALGFEVRRQRDALHAEQQRLQLKTIEEQQLRALSSEQRSVLEQQQAQLGEHEEALRERIDEVATLDSKLSRTARRKNVLQTRLKKLGTDNAELQARVEELSRAVDSATNARDEAAAKHAQLSASLESLGKQHASTRQSLDSLKLEHQSRTLERDGLLAQSEALRSERDQLTAERRAWRKRQAALTKRADGLEAALDAARAEARELRRRVVRLQRQAQPTETQPADVQPSNTSAVDPRPTPEPPTPPTPPGP